MRQAGVLAAAGLIALRDGVQRLADDHRRARLLAEGLARMPGITIDLATVQTNIVRFDVSGLGYTAATFAEALRGQGISVSGGAGPGGVRMVVHRHIDDEAVLQALEATSKLRS
jgi:threonine aldolase